jgi:hypothetical protein
MKKSRFTESQIIKAVKDHESVRDVTELCRELGIHLKASHFIDILKMGSLHFFFAANRPFFFPASGWDSMIWRVSE